MNAKKFRLSDAAVTAAALALGAVLVFPIVYCFLSSFKDLGEFMAYPPTLLPESFGNTGNFSKALTQTPILRFMLNSLIVALIGTALRILFAAMAAFAFAYYDFPGKKILFAVVLAIVMLPDDTLVVSNYLTVTKLRLLDNYLGMCVTSLAGASQMFLLRQHFKTIPKEMYEAAQMDGCGSLNYIFRVIVPVSRPILMTLAVQSFIGFWNSYLWPLLVTNREEMRTVQVGVTMLTTLDATSYSLVMAAVTIVTAPSILLFLILRRNIVEGMSSGILVG